MKDKINDFITKFKEVDKKEFIKKHDKVIAISMISFSGMLCLGMGVMLPFVPIDKNDDVVFLKVSREHVEKMKSNKIVLKEMSSEVNQPISVDVKDYVDVNLLDSKTLKSLKLDTSLVNITQPGNYTYTIKCKNKTYTGIYVIKEKPLPQIDNMTLRNIDLQIGAELPKNIESYVVEQLSDEVKANIQLDLSKVNVNIVGSYPYTVTYNGKAYAGVVNITEPAPPVSTTPPADPNAGGVEGEITLTQ